jgi:predicted RNase H-like HicB family nuclease
VKQYRLPVIMYESSDDTENKYMAEIPLLPGCHAWGTTPAETLQYLQRVSTEFILSYKTHGHALPKNVEECAYELVGPKVKSEVTVVFE